MAKPRMSVIIIVYAYSASLRLVLEHLRLQTVAGVLECILVVSCRETAQKISNDLREMAAVQIALMNPAESIGFAKAAGVLAATAPLVVFLEDHSVPGSQWAESLLKASEGSEFAAIGAVVQNANPATGASWGCFLVYYGQYAFVRPRRDLKHLPAMHSCYRRDVLLDYGPRLPELLESESLLHQDLLARNFQLRQESTARIYHINYSRLRPILEEYFFASRVFAAARSAGWKFQRKSIYFLGSPLLPLIRSWRILKDARKANFTLRVLLKAALPVVLTLCAGALGEMAGYSLGVGNAKSELKRIESQRHENLSDWDLEISGTV
jgi:glycosyltransferase involved in cell wall biosynthesis